MPSIHPRYEYDIFISYRHNDNRSGWVTNFLDALQEELAATIKEPLTIYFDRNPHDGLSETHDVDQSLKEKVKCLIFIPIVSRTYCDTTCFAWQKEFMPFLNFIKNDPIGMTVKVSNGNVNTRMLPIRIHELDPQDIDLFEKETGSVMRGVDFVYKSAGVNRPLLPTDAKEGTQNKIYYRDQINKVANTISDIIKGIKNPDTTVNQKIEVSTIGSKTKIPNRKGLLLGAVITLFMLITAIAYWKWSTADSGETITTASTRKSLAVIPFKSLTTGENDEYFADGLTEELINTLSGIPDLQVTGRTSSFYFKDKDSPTSEIASTLRVDHLVEGTVRKSGDSLRITVQFVRASDGINLWSHAYNEPLNNILEVQTSIAKNIAQALNILLDKIKSTQMNNLGVNNIDAFIAFQKGYLLFRAAHGTINRDSALIESNKYFDQAIALAPNFSQAHFLRTDYYGHTLLGTIEPSNNYTNQEINEARTEFRQGLEMAIKYSRDQGSALIHKSDLIIFSNDWSTIPTIMNQIMISGTCDRPNWIQNFYYLKSQNDPDIATFFENRIDCDPLREENYQNAALAYAHANQVDKALEVIDERLNIPYLEKSNTISYFIKSLLLNAQGNYDEARQILALHDSEREKNIEGARFAALKRDSTAVINFLKTNKKLSQSDRIRLNAFIGNRKEANALAATLDQHPLGSLELLTIPRYCMCGAPFDIEATPNFKKRLEEAGLPWPPLSLIKYPLKDW